jgi:hypothetical protein
MHSIVLTAIVATALTFAGPFASAYPCSQSEQQSALGLFRSAAQRSGCAPYAKFAADGGVTINWSCSTTTCTPTMMQLALQLPNCETPSDGKNRKASLENSLYSQCQFCTPDQRNQMSAIWKSVAQTSACSKYASAGGTFFSWPCSATSCTATIKGVADKMPSCIVDKQNERTRILNSITACTRTSVATKAPSAVSTPSGVGTSPPSTTRPPVAATPSPPRATTSPPTTTRSPDGNNSPASPATNESSTTCTLTEIDTMLALFVGAAQGSNCKSYGTVSPYGVRITAPCTSSCVTSDITALADALPDCYYAYEAENKKTAVAKELAKCKPVSGRRERALLGDVTEQFLSLQVDSKAVIKGASSNTPSSTTSRPPAVSSAPTCYSSVWFAGALIGLTALVA